MKNKILIFILVFCLCFLCFVIPSFASDDDISLLAVTDLNGTSWEVPSGWSASAGYGKFSAGGTYYVTDDASTGNFNGFNIGYNAGNVASANIISSQRGTTPFNFSNTKSRIFTFTSGDDLSNPLLISWLETYGTNVTPTPEPETGLIESGWDYMTSPPSLNLPPILVRPDPSFIPVGASLVYTGIGTYYLDNGLPYVFTHFAWELTSYTNSDNYTLEFQVQRESGVWITLYTFVVQSGTQTIVFYPDVYYFTLNSDVEVDIDSYNLFYSHFAPQLDGGIDDPDDLTDNPWLYIIEKVIEALKYPMWGYFSPWDIVTTISGIFIVTWLLKLIAGG